MSEEIKSNQEYGADQIQILEGLEAVRKRPAMYIGSKDWKRLEKDLVCILEVLLQEDCTTLYMRL